MCAFALFYSSWAKTVELKTNKKIIVFRPPPRSMCDVCEVVVGVIGAMCRWGLIYTSNCWGRDVSGIRRVLIILSINEWRMASRQRSI